MNISDLSQHLPEPSKEQICAAFNAVKEADLAMQPMVPTRIAVTLVDAYLHAVLKLKALEENT